MKLAWFSHTAETNGAELSLLEACRGLIKKGHDISVIVPGDGPLLPLLVKTGVKVYSTPYLLWTCSSNLSPSINQKARRVVSLCLSAKKLKNILLEISPDITVSNTLTIPSGALAARWAGIPHVWYIHEFGEEDHGLGYYFGDNLSFYFMRKLSAKVIVNSDAVFHKFHTIMGKDKLRRIYYAIDIPVKVSHAKIESIHTRTLSLIQVGRIIESKKPDDAIRAVGILVHNGFDVRLTFLGNSSNDYRMDLEKLILEEKVKDRVVFLPFAENPINPISQADILLMCSKNEAFGRVTIEAMKQGLSVVGARSGGTTELIKDGWNGFLYQPGNYRELAEKIEILYHNRNLLVQMGDNAQTWARANFTIDKYTSALETVFNEVTKS